MKISEIVKKGKLKYTYHYLVNDSHGKTARHTVRSIDAPNTMIILLKKAPNAEVVTFGDSSLGVLINEKIWAKEIQFYGEEYINLNSRFWQYCYLALNRNGDTYS